MPDKKDDEKLPNQSIPAADIPNLKKQDQDRKKSGAAWGSAKPAGTPFAGARGVASGAGSVGAVGGGSSGGIGNLLAALVARVGNIVAPFTSTLLGKAVAMAIAAIVVGGLATVAFRMMSRTGTPSTGAPELGAPSSSIKVARDTSDNRLEYAANSAKGKLDWANKPIAPEDVKADEAGDAAKDAEAAASDKAADAAEMAQDAMPEGAMPPGGAGQSGSMGSRFGSHDIFGGRSGFGSGGSGGKSVVPNYASKSGAGQKFAQASAKSGSGGTVGSRRAMGSNRFNLRGLKTSRALAQLRGMAPLNSQIRSGSRATEYNAVQAQSQFEGTDLIGASAPVSPTDDDPGTGTGTGSGTGSGTGTGTGSYTPTVEECGENEYWNGSQCTEINTNGYNVTPWQTLVATAEALLDVVKMLLMLAAVFLLLGAIFYCTVCSYAWGVPFGAIGAVLAGIACGLSIYVKSIAGQIAAMGGSPQDQPISEAATKYAWASGIMCAIAFIVAAGSAAGIISNAVAWIVIAIGTFASVIWAKLG